MVKNKVEKLKNKNAPIKELQSDGDAVKNKIWEDERFQHLVSDPRFKVLPKAHGGVKIGKRFQSMFNDDKFKVKYTVDKYGRRVNKSNSDDLKKYYELESSTDSETEEQKDKTRKEEEEALIREEKEFTEKFPEKQKSDEDNELGSDVDEIPKSLRERLTDPNIDYARGEGRLLTDSSDDDSIYDDSELYVEHVWGELDADTERTENSTKRLAVCNMDWDRIRATDLMVLFSSFLPPGGSILNVKIYLSEFGKERLYHEEKYGPAELVGLGKKSSLSLNLKETCTEDSNSDLNDSNTEEELVEEQESDAAEGDDYHMEKLRQYQMNRLRYYYAVVECDSVQSADKIYRECDGIEYESSATRVDLRFIPDDTTFDEDEPSDVCTELPENSTYKPRQFTTTALQQAKVDLTWDETAVERRELGDKLSSGKLDEISDKDLKKIVAYSSEEDEQDVSEDERKERSPKTEQQIEVNEVNEKSKRKLKKEDAINKYKGLLTEISEKEEKAKQSKNYNMEFTWDVNADAQSAKDQKDLSDKKAKLKMEMTPINKVLQKRSEKNKMRKEQRRKKMQQSESDSDSIPDGIDMNDPYFAEEFASGDFIGSKASRKVSKKSKNQLTQEQEVEEKQNAKELQLLLDDDELEQKGKEHFSLEKIQRAEQETKSKRKRRKQLKKPKSFQLQQSIEGKEAEDSFQMNINDKRFKAIYSSHHFNIDPTNSHFKKTKGMDQIIHEKLKQRSDGNKIKITGNLLGQDDISAGEQMPKRPKKQLENILLVKSLKQKLQANRHAK